MRILVYLAALAIFLFIVNLGAQWLGDDEVKAPGADAVEATAETSVAPAVGTQDTIAAAPVAAIEAAVEEPLAELAPTIDSAIAPEAASSSTVTAPILEPEVVPEVAPEVVPEISTADATPSQEASVVSSDAAVIAAAPNLAEQARQAATETSPQAANATDSAAAAAPSSAIERFASSAQDVAEDAVDSVSNTIKNVSAAISGSDGDGLNQPLVPDSIAALMRRHEDRELLVLFWHPQDETVTESFEWLGRMQTRYGNQGITTVAVNLASELGNSGERLVAHGSNIEQRSDPERILARAFWVQQVPSIFLLAADGTLLRRIEGFDQAQIGSYEDSVRQAARR